MSDRISPQDKAGILLETMPWLRRYSGQIVVIKYGGNAMVDESLKRAFAQDVLFLHQWGVRPVVVHGGGPQINAMLARLGLEAPFEHGLRVTTQEVMEIVRMVLLGKVQRELVSLLNQEDYQAMGLAGEDAGLFRARRTPAWVDGEPVDVGLVGEITHVNAAPVLSLLDAGRIPVISSVAPDEDQPGGVLNVNADLAASALAGALGAEKLLMLTDVEGLYANWPDRSTLISRLTDEELREMLPSVESGMAPKMRAALAALDGGVPMVHIIDGRRPHSMLLEIFTDDGVGTMITAAHAEAFPEVLR
ncbi:MAG: acetylglutamate kinase [Actinomyces sp.]|jgi:acetylglutamate kinase|nr:acetylglutamate kinase [Actinomyces sp.]MCI1642542.1 acetylglutamate kinase [Actinomyces sp.]MCI1663136.1 acetylglutamate kinase [Actinomyces sp.]MCI1691290.1 acetylglutamate kinase [Actinomyces sp.]MCI1787681.1 acetylglutamate kinase [Actinomyces sp.]MCI1830411.1 acetylglutamate kinase [Actinomyces sp.]